MSCEKVLVLAVNVFLCFAKGPLPKHLLLDSKKKESSEGSSQLLITIKVIPQMLLADEKVLSEMPTLSLSEKEEACGLQD